MKHLVHTTNSIRKNLPYFVKQSSKNIRISISVIGSVNLFSSSGSSIIMEPAMKVIIINLFW